MSLSDMLGPALQIGSTILSAGGQVERGNAGVAVANRRKAALEFQAQQLETEAGQSKAVSQVQAADVARQNALVQSSILARAAASGAGASDPSVLSVMARTGAESAYRQAVALYEGEAQARMDLTRASAARFEGQTNVSDAASARRQANIGAGATVLAGGAKSLSMYDKYYSGAGTSDSDIDPETGISSMEFE